MLKSVRPSFRTLRLTLLSATVITVFPTTSLAQPPAGPNVPGQAASSAASDGNGNDVVITGSRISQNGNNLPTPVTIVAAEQLQLTTPTSVPDALVKLPVFNQGSATANNSVNSNGRGFNAPGTFLNMRNLGAIRTLILQDGNRVPGTFYDQTVDTNMLPQLLIQRVEVVTGGASSVYGSDAVTGVVNFITDTKFTGLKGVVQGGISKYSDAKSARAGVAYGTDVGDRGHFIASAEYFKRNGVKDTATRPFGRLYPAIVSTVGGTGSAGAATNPYIQVLNARQSNVAPGGLARTGPFAGQQFLNDGSLAPFNPGTATGTANAAIGGDGGRVENEWLLNDIRTAQAFARFDYDLTDSTHFYVQGRYSSNRTFGASQIYTNVSNASPSDPLNSGGSYPLWIYSGNAFLTAAQQAALTTAGVSSFALNRMDNDLMRQLGLELKLRASAVTFGINGTLGGYFAWDAHYSRGDNRTRYTTHNNVNSANFFAAVDAVRDPATGQTVCRVSITAPGAFPGCAPLNLFGQGRASQAAQDFVFEDTWWLAKNSMDDFGANLTGTAFEGWAGPIKFAVGGQYRHQTLDVTTSTPDTTFNAQNLRLGAAGNSLPASYPGGNLRYFKEVQAGAVGSADIYEANVETNVPLLRDLPFAELVSFNGAFRYAKYNVKGNQVFKNDFSSKTWKLGLEWQVIDGLRFRATRSRDFRAPTLWELYQNQIISASGVTDALTKTSGSVNTVAGGNPNLKPEIGKNLTVGAVLQPSFLRGFSISVDYFKIRLTDAIGGINGLNQQVQDICLASPNGSSPYCGLVTRPISYNNTSPANYPTLVYNLSQNTVRTDAEGIDVEVNYATSLGNAGNLTLRGLYSHQWKLISTAFPGALGLNSTGTQAVPRHKINLMASYRLGAFGFDLMQRYYSPVKWDANPAIVYNMPKLAAYWQTDINLSHDFKMGGGDVTAFVNVSNLFNNTGPLYQDRGYTGSIGLRYPTLNYADIVGRYYTAGVRFKF